MYTWPCLYDETIAPLQLVVSLHRHMEDERIVTALAVLLGVNMVAGGNMYTHHHIL